MNEKPKRKNDDKYKNDERESHSHIVEYILILLVVMIIVVVGLAMMGPVIGNIFSNIHGCTLGMINH